jgi:hypothetical protein
MMNLIAILAFLVSLMYCYLMTMTLKAETLEGVVIGVLPPMLAQAAGMNLTTQIVAAVVVVAENVMQQALEAQRAEVGVATA